MNLFCYHDLLHLVLQYGEPCGDRTGTGTRSMFGQTLRIGNIQDGDFPLLTTKDTHWKSIVHELLWFIRGDTNVHYLQNRGVKIWDAWANKWGDLGPVYGAQWRSWRGADGKSHDQLKEAIRLIREDPDSRRILVNSWNVGELNRMALPPCHMFFQFKVYGKNLDLVVYQRSADLFLGVPFNIASYALLQRMVAQVTGKKSRQLVMMFGDAHIYDNHQVQVRELLERNRQGPPIPPTVELNPDIADIDDFTFEDINLVGYRPLPKIKAPVAV